MDPCISLFFCQPLSGPSHHHLSPWLLLSHSIWHLDLTLNVFYLIVVISQIIVLLKLHQKLLSYQEYSLILTMAHRMLASSFHLHWCITVHVLSPLPTMLGKKKPSKLLSFSRPIQSFTHLIIHWNNLFIQQIFTSFLLRVPTTVLVVIMYAYYLYELAFIYTEMNLPVKIV